MISNRFMVALALSAGLSLTACSGGGGGGNGSDGSGSGSGGGGSSGGGGTPAEQSGVFLDAAVAGINYRTATRSGQTDAQGRYVYLPGETVTFSIGDVTLPAVTAAGVVTPLTIFGVQDFEDRRVVNLARLLQTLDSDNDTTNGLQISAATHAAAAGASLNFDQPVTDFENEAELNTILASTSDTVLISAADAVAHLRESTSIVGSWHLIEAGPYSTENDYLLYNFFADGTYLVAESTAFGESDPTGMPGIEAGTYSWDPTTGKITATPSIDTNGSWGLSVNLEAITIRRSADTLAYNDSSDPNDIFTFQFQRAVENGLQGAWVMGGASDRAVVTFTADGYYGIAEIGPATSTGMPGGEFGTYTVDATATPNTFTATTYPDTDTNGDRGLSGDSGIPVQFTISGDTLTMTFSDDSTATATRLK